MGLPLRARQLQRFRAPRIPVHRIVRVLLQIRAGFLRQPVLRRIRCWSACGRLEYRPHVRSPSSKLKRGEDRRLRAGHLWVFSNEVDTAATPLTQFEPGAAVRVHSDRDQFLGYAYVNPRTLICRAHRQARRRPIHSIGIAARASPARRAGAARAAVPRAVLPAGVRRVGRAAGTGAGSLWRRAWWRRAAPPASTGCAPRSRTRSRKVVGPRRPWSGRTTPARASSKASRSTSSAAHVRAQIPEEIDSAEQGVELRRAARAGTEDRLVLRPGREPRAPAPLPAGRRARARCVQLCRRLGGHGAEGRRGQRHLRGFVGHGARLCRSATRSANGVGVETLRDDAFDALQGAAGAGARFDVVVLDPPAFIKRKKDVPQATAAYRKLNQLALPLIERDGLLVSCSCSYHMPADDLADGHPGRGAAQQPVRADPGAGRAVAGSSGASGDSRNPLSQGLFLPRYARMKRRTSSLMIQYPGFDKIAFEIGPFGNFGPLKVHWYGIMYLVAFAAGWWLARLRARSPAPPGSPATSTTSCSSACSASSSAGASATCCSTALSFWAQGSVVSVQDLGRRHVVPRRLARRACWRSASLPCAAGAAWPTCSISPRRCRASALFAGRIGNFINGELWGKTTDVPWGFIVDGEVRHASQLYEAALEGLVLFIILWLYTSKPRPRMAPSGLFLRRLRRWRAFIVEFVRVPDEHSAISHLGWLTMGMMLSAADDPRRPRAAVHGVSPRPVFRQLVGVRAAGHEASP